MALCDFREAGGGVTGERYCTGSCAIGVAMSQLPRASAILMGSVSAGE